MQDNNKTPLDRAVGNIINIIKVDIVSCGEKNLSMGFLTNSFSTAISTYLRDAGLPTQIAILSDPASRSTPIPANAIDTKDVASVILSTAYEVVHSRMKPKMVEMIRRVHRDETLDTLQAIAKVLERASLENDPGFNHDLLRTAATFALKTCEDGLQDEHEADLSSLPAALQSLMERRRDKAFLQRLGEPLENLVRLTNRAADLVELNAIDPDGLRQSISQEISGRQKLGFERAA